MLSALLARRAPRSICPSEAARALSDDWRPLMEAVRAEAATMQDEGLLTATQRGLRVDPRHARGPIRLTLG